MGWLLGHQFCISIEIKHPLWTKHTTCCNTKINHSEILLYSNHLTGQNAMQTAVDDFTRESIQN